VGAVAQMQMRPERSGALAQGTYDHTGKPIL
jgi:hypothetical protein